MLIVNPNNLASSPSWKEPKERRKDDIKKTLPTILDIVLQPDLFLNATYLPEFSDIGSSILNNKIEDDDYDNYDDGNDEYVIATLDELYDEVNSIYDDLYDTAEPTKPQPNIEDKTKPVTVETTEPNHTKEPRQNDVPLVFPSTVDPLINSPGENEIEESDYREGSGQFEDQRGRDEITIDSTRIEFPRNLDNVQKSLVKDNQNDVDYEYPDIDMPVLNTLEDSKGIVELSDHNRLFPTPPSVNIINDKRVGHVEETCYCPCQCTEKHTNPIPGNNIFTTEDSRTSSYTTR